MGNVFSPYDDCSYSSSNSLLSEGGESDSSISQCVTIFDAFPNGAAVLEHTPANKIQELFPLQMKNDIGISDPGWPDPGWPDPGWPWPVAQHCTTVDAHAEGSDFYHPFWGESLFASSKQFTLYRLSSHFRKRQPLTPTDL